VICCPNKKASSDADQKVQAKWDEQTTKLLYVLSHGDLKGAPRLMPDDPLNGWKEEDRLYGVGVCPQGREDAIKDYDWAQTKTQKQTASQTKQETCTFKCEKKKGMFGTEPCKKRDQTDFTVQVKTDAGKKCEGTFGVAGDIKKKATKECQDGPKISEEQVLDEGYYNKCDKVRLVPATKLN